MVSAYTESGEMVLFMCAQQIHFVFIPNKRNHTLDHYCRMFLNRLFPLHTFIASNYRIFLKCHCISFMFSVFFLLTHKLHGNFHCVESFLLTYIQMLAWRNSILKVMTSLKRYVMLYINVGLAECCGFNVVNDFQIN